MYKVLWLDDQYKTSEATLEEAMMEGIELIGYTNSKEGVVELKENYRKYDAVILDGLFYKHPDQTGTNITGDAFGEAGLALSELKAKGIDMPWFIFSGQPSFRKSDNPYIGMFKDETGRKRKIYDKNKDEDFQELCQLLKDTADKRPIRQARLSHPQVFKIFSNNFLDYKTEKNLIGLLQKLNSTDRNEHPKTEFTELRKIIEKLVDVSCQKSLIPAEVGTKNLTESVNFLCNKSNEFLLLEDYFHPTINAIFPTLLTLLQDGSHSKEELRYRVEEFALQQNNGYLFKSFMYQLLDVMIAFNQLFEKQKSNRLSPPLWEKAVFETLYEGILQKDDSNNYYCGEYLLEYKKFHNIHEPGIRLRILKAAPNNISRTKHLYPYFAPIYKIIE